MRFFKIIFIVSIVGCLSEKINLPYFNSPDFTPIFIDDNDLSKINHKISDYKREKFSKLQIFYIGPPEKVKPTAWQWF